MLDENGQNPVEFLHNAQFVSWSPNGLHFLFFSGREENVVNTRVPLDLYLGNSDNAGEAQMISSGVDAAILPHTIRWLDHQTYIFEAVAAGSQDIQLWRGVIGNWPAMLGVRSGN
jgi:hypothetical protein